MPATGGDGWSGDGTARTMAWLECRAVGETGGKTSGWEKGYGRGRSGVGIYQGWKEIHQRVWR